MQNNSIISLKRRLLAMFLLVSFLFLLIMIRLGYLQLVKGSWLQARAIDQWTRELPLNALRGDIVDTNGVVLATNYTTYDIYIRPSMVQDANNVAYELSRILGLDYDKVYFKATDMFVSESLVKLQVKKSVVDQIKEKNLVGVVFSENNSRYYPYNDMLTQVLGFTTIDNVGQAGLEAYYDKYLTGVDGYILEESDVKGVKLDNTLTTYVPSIAGMNLQLTIDMNIQRFAEDALKVLMEEQKPKKASAIVMNPNNGAIVAMATMPNFDLNNVPRNNVSELMETVKNINIVDVYEPGSTFKCVTMANSIELGYAKLTDSFYDPGYRIVDNEKIKCWKLTGHGHQTLSEGLCNSCNSVFVDLSLRMGKDNMYEMFDKYGIGEVLGVDFMGESGGIVMDYDSSKTVDLARMGFGQAVAMTPLQLINAICSIVNGGTLYQPYFLKSMTDSNGDKVYENFSQKLGTTISKETSEIMKDMMIDVIEQYSGYYAFIPGYDVGGKTGTSQKYGENGLSGEYIASFVGVFPGKDPDYVVLIVVDEPGGASYYGSIAATPYAKMIIENIIDYKDYVPVRPEEIENYSSRQMVAMPNVVGMDIYKAIDELEGMGLQVEVQGSGNMVTSQFPKSDVEVIFNGIVMIEVM